MENRYYVDERVGCTAVRDRTLTDPAYPGLHVDTKGVVRFWQGVFDKGAPCEACGHQGTGHWVVPEGMRVEAQELCDSLNAGVDTAESEDICGLCGLPGANKYPHPVHWPGEQSAGTKLVHAECEAAECSRAHSLLTEKQREDFLEWV